MIESWPEELDKQINDARGKEFKWGKFDCCLWAADVVKALTGVDHAKEFRGKYRSQAGAKKALGNKSLQQLIDSKLPKTKCPNRGDVVLIPKSVTGQDLPALGICVGVRIAIIGDDGLEFLPVSVISAAWSIHDG